jgi:hypothetical protein
VSGHRSGTGRPLLVGGPQLGYEYPGLTLEMDLSGPHIHVRGATAPPFPGYMLIGRGTDFAWTLTSAARRRHSIPTRSGCAAALAHALPVPRALPADGPAGRGTIGQERPPRARRLRPDGPRAA